MGYVKNMVSDHEDRLREMDCDMAQLRLKLVELQSLREGFKHFITDHWLPLIQYLHSFPNTQCSCRTDARNGADSASSYHTLPQCLSLRPIPPPQTRPPLPSPSISTLDSQSDVQPAEQAGTCSTLLMLSTVDTLDALDS